MRSGEVNPQLPSIYHLLLQVLLGALGGSNVDEVGVGEAARLAGAAVDGDTDVEDVADFAEEVCDLRMVSAPVTLPYLPQWQ